MNEGEESRAVAAPNEDLLADYVGEAHDYLERLRALLHGLEPGSVPHADAIDELFRVAHSLKGLSASFGFQRTNAVTHSIESLLSRLRTRDLAVESPVLRALLDGVDLLEHLTAEVAAGGSETTSFDLVGRRLDVLAGGPQVTPAAAVATADASAATAGNATNAANAASSVLANASAAVNRLQTATLGQAEEPGTVRVHADRLDRLVGLMRKLAEARARFQGPSAELRSLPRVRELERLADVALAALAVHSAGDYEARVARARQAVRELRDQLRHAEELERLAREIEQATADLGSAVASLYGAVTDVRLVPFASVFRRLQLVVRATAEQTGKHVEASFYGRDTQVDKNVADELVNPLVHLLRNAIDHGIEAPRDRAAAGKPLAGALAVRASVRGGAVVVEVEDDGRGIDPAKVKARAVRTGLVTAQAAAAMTQEQLQRLVFLPGLSTADAVTELSGRGVGMDVVETTVLGLGGTIELSSVPGKGTRFRIAVPVGFAPPHAER